ncbi:hypothetical protein [Paracoccus benzoatiresistens]|uniref:Uncharacterized protein n=1 Tax=Paracoccus benzoatiresistens TaxID=2997341 RepID=A0ABT4J8T3_9RHOB|nr:hypothetical protein [Paracoccus sp. EF6]MCZ0963497.1 hypothetical protein [Paracoccus sp. EF6]
MTSWKPVDTFDKDIDAEPWSMFWREVKSESDEFRLFITNPLSQMVGVLPEVEKDWSVKTNILNHEIGFTQNMVCTVAIVDGRSKTVFLSLYKHPLE